MKLIIVLFNLIFTATILTAQNPYSFFVAGHTYGKPGVNNIGFHPPFKQKFSYIQSRPEIKFGVLTGDIVSPNPTPKDWDEIDSDIDLLGLPIYFAVGNHDMENRSLFESRYGSTYYSFNFENDLFIVLDPNIDEWNISGDQFIFLKNVLNDNYLSKDNIFVFFHQVIWRESHSQFEYIQLNSYAGKGASVNFWTEIEPLFNALPNEVIMFAGDLGAPWASDVSYDKYENITLISSGMGDEKGENFIVVNVDSNNPIDYNLICLSDTIENCLGKLDDHLVVDKLNNKNNSSLSKSFIYPNPGTNSITLKVEDYNSKTVIRIYNSTGKIVSKEKYLKKSRERIDLTGLQNGIYFLKINNGQDIKTIKFFKQ